MIFVVIVLFCLGIWVGWLVREIQLQQAIRRGEMTLYDGKTGEEIDIDAKKRKKPRFK